MDVFIGTSLVAAFVAGVAALFAPCCIAVLLPSYLANVFKERYKVFFMTFVFFLGIATVFLPIGLGASALSQAFSAYHNQIFTAGGLFLLVLGLSMLFGKKVMVPVSARNEMRKRTTSVYLLGVFSAISTTCCAPVLAGVLALSVASGSVAWGSLYTLAYVLGMTAPLFVIAAFLDKANLTDKWKGARKTLGLRIGSYSWKLSASELVSSVIFLAMGSFITYSALNNSLYSHSDYQLTMNMANARFMQSISGFVRLMPEYAWAAAFIAIAAGLTMRFIKLAKQSNGNS